MTSGYSAHVFAPALLVAILAAADGGAVETDAGVTFEVVAVEALPQRLERVEITGLSWTKEYVAHRELQLVTPGEVSATAWQLGLTRLWNCGLFSRVDGRLERRPEGVVGGKR